MLVILGGEASQKRLRSLAFESVALSLKGLATH